jgi:hypothetical protein
VVWSLLVTVSVYSFGTPAVPGVATYFLSHEELRSIFQEEGQVAQRIKDFIVQKAYARDANGLTFLCHLAPQDTGDSGERSKGCIVSLLD